MIPRYTHENALALLQRIQDALGTGETGDELVQVARDAHTAEQQLAAIIRNSAREYADL